MLTRKEQTNRQTIRQTDGSKTETTLSSVDTRGSWPINSHWDSAVLFRYTIVLYSTIQYIKVQKMRKFADKEQRTINQVNGSNTEATLILCGYSGERANLPTIKQRTIKQYYREEDEEKKN